MTASSCSFSSSASASPKPSSISLASLPSGCWPWAGARHCQKKLWFHSCALLLNSLRCRPPWLRVDHLDQRGAVEVAVFGRSARWSCDIGLVMLAVMIFERLGRHVRRQRILGDTADREAGRACQGNSLNCREKAAAAANPDASPRPPASQMLAPRAIFNPRNARTIAEAFGDEGGSKWANSSGISGWC